MPSSLYLFKCPSLCNYILFHFHYISHIKTLPWLGCVLLRDIVEVINQWIFETHVSAVHCFLRQWNVWYFKLWLLNAWHMSAVRIWLMTCLIVLAYQEELYGTTCYKSLSNWGNRSLNEHFCEGDFPHWHHMYSTKSSGDRNSLKKTRSSICQYFLIYNVTIMLC